MSDLPENWVLTRFGEIAKIRNGYAFKSSDFLNQGVPLIRQSNLSGNKVYLEKCVYLPIEYLEKYKNFQIKKGDLLIGMSGSIGKLCRFDSDVVALQNQRTGLIQNEAEEFSCKSYFWHYLKTLEKQLLDKAKGVAVANVSASDIEALPFPCPPIEEQRRIADKLDTTLARVDALNDRLARITPLLKRFRQSVLAAATSGRLTEDWRDYEEFNAPEMKLSEIGKISGGLTKNSKRNELPLKTKYLRVANVHANELRLDEVLEIGVAEAEFEKTKLQKNDLLIVEGNGSIDQIGRVAIWNDEIHDCCHQNHLIRWRAAEKVDPKFVLYFLLSPTGRKNIVAVASSTTGLHTLSVSKVGALSLGVPSLQEQTEIVRRVEILLAYADRLEARLQSAQTAAERLTPALLAKAFSGELVPQDPNDEPATELLRRLRAARAADTASKPKRGRKAGAATPVAGA